MIPNALVERHCVASYFVRRTVTEKQKAEYLAEIPEWRVVEQEGSTRLERIFTFPDFTTAWLFTQKVVEMADAERHSPVIVVELRSVKLQWWSPKILGLHRNDFIAAAKTNVIFNTTVSLPPIITTCIQAVNAHNTEALLACFIPDGSANYFQSFYHGAEQLREWAVDVTQTSSETWEIIDVGKGHNSIALTVVISGDYDYEVGSFRGRLYFNLKDDKILWIIGEDKELY